MIRFAARRGGGHLELSLAPYHLRQETTVPHDNISGAPGALLELSATLQFDGSVWLSSSLEVAATRPFGTCIEVHGYLRLQAASALKMRNCESTFHGGALQDGGALTVENSSMFFEDCSAELGGAVYVARSASVLRSTMNVSRCRAAKSGGGFYVGSGEMALTNSTARFVMTGTDASFTACGAGIAGGGLDVEGVIEVAGDTELQLSDCHAPRGSALHAAFGMALSDVRIKNCTGLGPDMVVDTGTLSANHIALDYDGPENGETFYMVGANISVSELDCTNVSECIIGADAGIVTRLHCPPGRGRLSRSPDYGCFLCESGRLGFAPEISGHKARLAVGLVAGALEEVLVKISSAILP